MRLKDYTELAPEANFVRSIYRLVGTHPHQHEHRTWEYAMLLRSFNVCEMGAWPESTIALRPGRGPVFEAADVGCGVGLAGAFLLGRCCNVTLYESWAHGDEEAFQLDQMRRAQNNMAAAERTFRSVRRGLRDLLEEDHCRYDIVACVSTLEHIPNYSTAFLDLLSMVRPQGWFFLTTDFAEHHIDHYAHAGLRAGLMFTIATYLHLADMALKSGFEFVGGDPDWDWSEDCRLVNDYGFASLVMRRK